MDKHEQKKLRTKTKHDFLHTFFPTPTGYQVIEVNGFILVNQYFKPTDSWQVAIMTKESYKKVLEWKEKQDQEADPITDPLFPSEK